MSLFSRIRNAITERLKDYRRERMIREYRTQAGKFWRVIAYERAAR